MRCFVGEGALRPAGGRCAVDLLLGAVGTEGEEEDVLPARLGSLDGRAFCEGIDRGLFVAPRGSV